MKFLDKIITELLAEHPDLSGFTIVIPGKRPAVFIKKILAEKQYSGFLPTFCTIEELIAEISGKQPVQGIALWLMAYDSYQQLDLTPKDDFASFLKWFPTVQKDWDDMLKFSDDDRAILEFMFDEERIKNWAQKLGEETEEVPRKKFLNFWKNMNVFLPFLKKQLQAKNLATAGMIHEAARNQINSFADQYKNRLVFCGFNAFTPVEEQLVRQFLQRDKAQIYFHGDRYYTEDERQEAGIFLRKYQTWKEFNKSRKFRWIEDDFSKPKQIKVYEVSGNVSQAQLLPNILNSMQNVSETDLSDTAVVLLDEHLLPAALDSLSTVEQLNITMGFPLKNMAFSNAVKHIFHLQKQLAKRPNSYYYNDVLPILEELPNTSEELKTVVTFKSLIEERNIVYFSESFLKSSLDSLSYFPLLIKAESSDLFLKQIYNFCYDLKFRELDDLQFENIAHFEKTFKIIKNQTASYQFDITIETLEVLMNQVILSETIDFQGEPLQGLQLMGLLETRLLNFKNVIMLSVNEGKLPLGNTQNTYLPYDVRQHFGLHTFLENDSIYAYHFYRLIQESDSVHLLFNALSSGVNTGEKSRFITQLEFEDQIHSIEHTIIENLSASVEAQPIEIEKTAKVMERLREWKKRVSATHLTSYLYNPIDFYLNKVLETRAANEIEEQLSVKNYGNLVHYALQIIYDTITGKVLTSEDLNISDDRIKEAMNQSIAQLKHQPEFYERGINFIHKSIAERVVKNIISYDRNLVLEGHSLKIIALERKFEEVDFYLDETRLEKVSFYGFIDRIDELDGVLRVIDYKTAKTKDLTLSVDEKNIDEYLMNDLKKQALQLCIYQYVLGQLPEFTGKYTETAIWSLTEVNKGAVSLQFSKGNLEDAMVSIRNLILEILNPEVPFTEKIRPVFD